MSVVARMETSTVTTSKWGSSVKLQVVSPTEGDPDYEELKSFFAATPSGSLEMTIDNAFAAEQFQPGDHFYVTFDRVPGQSSPFRRGFSPPEFKL